MSVRTDLGLAGGARDILNCSHSSATVPLSPFTKGPQEAATQSMATWLDKFTHYDDLSLILGAGLALVFAFGKWVAPVSLVHPILLGRQAEVARVRKPGESAVYRNYGTGSMGVVCPHALHAGLWHLKLSPTASPSSGQGNSGPERSFKARFQPIPQVVGSRCVYAPESMTPFQMDITRLPMTNCKHDPPPWLWLSRLKLGLLLANPTFCCYSTTV